MIPPENPREAEDLQATGMACIVAGLQGNTDDVNTMLDDMTPRELRFVAESSIYVAMFTMTGGGRYAPTPEELDAMISALQAMIAELRAKASQ